MDKEKRQRVRSGLVCQPRMAVGLVVALLFFLLPISGIAQGGESLSQPSVQMGVRPPASPEVFEAGPDGSAFIRRVGRIESTEIDAAHPAGLAFSPAGNLFHVVEAYRPPRPPGTLSEIIAFTAPRYHPVDRTRVLLSISDPINLAFDSKANRLLFYQAAARQVIQIDAAPDGRLDASKMGRHQVRELDLQNPQGMTVDPASGQLFILDAGGPRIARIEPDADGEFENGIITWLDLAQAGLPALQGLAFDPAGGHLYSLSTAGQTLYELTVTGEIVATRDLSDLALSDPQGMVFAPSADLTDDPALMNLYIADTGLDPGEAGLAELSSTGAIVEVSFAEPESVNAGTFVSSLVQTIQAWQFSPPSPDSTGVAYLGSNRLLIADSEVDETPHFVGVNLFETNVLSATLVLTSTTMAFSDEPEGLSYNPDDGHLFFADDVDRRIYEMDPGTDGLYGTGDDVISFFSTTRFGSYKPLGVAYSADPVMLFIADYTNAEVYKLTPGGDGVINGISPDGDDEWESFDTASLGLTGLEGIAFNSENGLLYVVGSPKNKVAAMTIDGTLMHMIDISASGAIWPSGLTFGPSSLDPGVTHIYISDRGIAEEDDINENDGRVYEMTLPPIDTIAPETTLDTMPPDPDNDTEPTFSFSGSDSGGSGLAGFECQVDGGSWLLCTSPHTTATLGDGTHTFAVRSVDGYGNRDSSPASYTWLIDTAPPTTSLESTPPDPDNDNTPTFSFTGADPGGSGIDRLECRLDGGTWSACSSPHTTATLGDGSHTFEVRSVDNAGNIDLTPASYTWLIDTSPPTTSLTSTPPNPDNDSTPTFSFTGADPGGSGVDRFECRVDVGNWSTCSSPHTTATLGSGSHTFAVRSVDNAGNTDATPDSYTWLIDTAPPTTSFDSTPPNPDDDKTPTFSFSGSDSGGSGLAGFECRLDGGSWLACSSPHTTATLAEGSHTFEVRSVDNAGNRDPTPASRTWTIDATAPDTTLTSTPPDPDNDNTPTFSFTGADPGGSGIDRFECRVDTGSWSTCSSPHTTATLGDGSHAFEVRSVDRAGNTDPTPASHTWRIDTVRPDTTLTSTPTNPDNDNTPTFLFEGSDGGGSGVQGFECQVDGTAWSNCSSPYTTPGLSDGNHTFMVRAVDKADNFDLSPASYNWTIDTTPPDTSLTSTPPDPDNHDTPTFYFSGSDSRSGVSGFECRVDAGTWSACSNPHTTATLGDGVHIFEVQAVDNAGNIDPTPASHTWRIDTVPPDTTLTSTPPDPDNDNTPTFLFEGSDVGGSGVGSFECQVDATTWSNCSSPYTTPGLSDGEHTFAVRSVDKAGNIDATPASHTWTIDTASPDTTLTSTPPNPDSDNTPTFSFTGSGGAARFECRVDAGNWSACDSPYTSPTLDDGNHTFAVRAVDSAGNIDPTPASHTWTIDTVPPDTILTSTPPDPDDDDTPTFSFAGSDGAVRFECRADGGTWSDCPSPHTTATLGDGVHLFEVRAADSAGNLDPTPASHTWRIDTGPPDTTLTSTPPDPDNDSTPTFLFEGSDVGGSGVDGFECQVDATTWTDCSSPYTTPGLSDGEHTFVVRSVDKAGNVDSTPASHTWTIDTAPPDTTLTSTPPDPDSDNTPTFTFTGSSGPASFECRVDSGSWTACTSPHTTLTLSDGARTFEVRALDAAGNRDPSPASYSWTLDATPPEAGDDSGTSYTTDEESPFTTGNVLDNDGDPGGRPIDLAGFDDSGLAGTLIDNGDGTFDYDPEGQFEYLAVGQQAEDIFTYTIADAVGLTDSAEVIITVTGVNDAPSISDIPDQITLVGVPAGPVAFTVDDVDTAADSLSLSFLTSDPELVHPVSGVSFGGSGLTRSLVVTPTQGILGSAVVTVTVSDGDLEFHDAFLLSVEPRRIYLPVVFR